MTLIKYIWKAFKTFKKKYHHFLTYLIFRKNSIKYESFNVTGIPIVQKHKSSNLKIGSNFSLNNSYSGNIIGRQQPCILIADKNSSIVIGNNVGMSSTAIICAISIEIGDNVKIGGNSCIYDTDFHSLNQYERTSIPEKRDNVLKKPVKIGKNVFIGAHSTILKGVTIGDNTIIGACSVVTRNIPANQVWAGNPAKFVKNIGDD